jgi:hypothetical protein
MAIPAFAFICGQLLRRKARRISAHSGLLDQSYRIFIKNIAKNDRNRTKIFGQFNDFQTMALAKNQIAQGYN